MIGGRLHLGALGAAGEIGHQTVLPGGPLCGCGNRGCAELYCAGHGMVSLRNRHYPGEDPDLLFTLHVNEAPVQEYLDLLAQVMATEMIILDPGIGFGKDLDHNLTLLANLEHYKHFGLPLLLATSRKSFINAICPTKPKDRVAGTIASSLIGALQGVDMIRVHDVMEHKQFFAVLRETALRWSAWNS